MAESVLITGGAGFIGSNLVIHLVNEGYDVIVVDKLTYAGNRGNLEPVDDQITFHEGDISDRELISTLYEDVNLVVNLAAESHVDRSIESGDPFVESNVHGAFVLMDELRSADIDSFVQMSTDEVYGSIADGQFDESDALDPSSPYSASKASADLFATAFRKTYDLPVTVARCTNLYGPRQHPEKLIPKMIQRARAGDSLPVYGDGTNKREWLYVEDACNALQAILEDSNPEVYNIGGGTEKQNIEVVSTIVEQVGASEQLIEFVDDRPGHDFRYALNYEKLRSELGWDSSVSFEEGLRQTIDWYT
jgi:dTDP-glucose 4,6-dehydratase